MGYGKKRPFVNYIEAAKAGIRAGQAVSRLIKRFKVSSTQTESGGNDAGPVTDQYDARTVYRRKRLGRRQRKRLHRKKRFRARVSKVLADSKAIQMVLFRDNGFFTSVANGQNTVSDIFTLYSLGSSGVSSQRDVYNIMTASGDGGTSITPFYFRAAMAEISLKNTGTNGLYCELYYWIGRKKLQAGMALGGSTVASISSLFQNGMAAEPQNLSGGTTCAQTTFGVTPFQCNPLLEFVKIVKKQVIHMSPGQITDVVLKSFGDKRYEWEDLPNNVLDRRSKGIIIVFYGDPNAATDGTAGQPLATQLSASVVRTYHFVNDRPANVDYSCQTLAS